MKMWSLSSYGYEEPVQIDNGGRLSFLHTVHAEAGSKQLHFLGPLDLLEREQSAESHMHGIFSEAPFLHE